MSLLKGSFFLKISSLCLAVVTFLYINNEISRASRPVTDPSYKLIKLTAKSLPLKVRLATSPPDGYRISGPVVAKPDQIVAIGPEALLDEAFTAETSIVDVSENTHAVSKKIPVESVAGIHLTGDPYIVEVNVPIEKIPDEKAPKAAPAA